MKKTDKVFRPVYGLDAIVSNKDYQPGHIYFATDTGKIYLDIEENGEEKKKIVMGGSGASLFYAYDSEVIQKPGDKHYISLNTIDGADSIKQDDLIINQANGCFYKVVNVGQTITGEVECELLAVSGSGTGPSGPDGPSGGDTVSATITGIATRATFIYNKPSEITINVKTETEGYVDITFEVIGALETKTKKYEGQQANKDLKFDISELLMPGLNDVYIHIEAGNDGNRTYKYTKCDCIEMELIPSNINQARVITDNSFIDVIPIGTNLEKHITITIDGNELKELEKIVKQSGAEERIELPMQEHGYHTVKIDMYVISGNQKHYVTPLIYELAWAEEGSTVPIIWLGQYSDQINNYEVNKVQYMVYDPLTPEKISFDIVLGKENGNYKTETIAYDSNNMLSWNISDYTIGKNNYYITYGKRTRNFEFTVVEDTSRENMELITSGLMINLDSQGRSNGEPSYTRTEWMNGSTKAVLNNFNWYNNGWIVDEKGISALRISNDATVSIPMSGIMKSSTLENGWTFEFRIKLRNASSYQALVSSLGTTTDDSGEVVEEKFDIIENFTQYSFGDYHGNGVGIGLGPADVFFQAGGAIANARIKEDELINITMVLDKYTGTNSNDKQNILYIYLNGIMSEAQLCKNDKAFAIGASAFNFVTNVCDIDLYKFRVYNRALSYREVVQNYVFDEKDIVKYDVNDIVSVDPITKLQTIDYAKLVAYNEKHKDHPTMPYAIIQMDDPSIDHDYLPYIKDEDKYLKCNVEFYNAPLDMAYENGTLTDVDLYKKSCPSFIATRAEINVQGTSSQGYPRRNYKIKFKKAEAWKMHRGPFKESQETIKKLSLDRYSNGETSFTWKADYMESSSCHNTGLANFIKNIYDKHPLKDYYPNEDFSNYRTTIYGFPMMVFQKKKDGKTLEFIGKYNFNYDKGCPSAIGFKYDKEHPVIADRTMTDIAECWEFKNNKGTRCSFKQVDFNELKENSLQLAVHDDFEFRYLSDAGDDFLSDYTGKNSKYPISEDNNKQALSYFSNLEKVCTWVNSTDTSIESLSEEEKQNRLNKFRDEFSKHFDLHYCAVYFILTELLIMYDSRGKNMMLASWGPKQQGGEYIWYPVFYDMDTQLGIENSGVPLWDYSVNCSEDQIFSTPDSVLWNNFYTCFRDTIQTTYNALRKQIIKPDTLSKYYDFDPTVALSPYAMSGLRPEMMYNIDAYYKYIAPGRTGYINTAGNISLTGRPDAYFYCVQGTRSYQRQQFLTNRFYYVDSKWQGGSFSYGNMDRLLQTRINYNATASTSDKDIGNADYPNAYDVPPYVHITPYLEAYTGVLIDSTPYFSTSAVKQGQPNKIQFGPNIEQSFRDIAGKEGQLLYFCGKEFVSNFGDLSRYYLNEIDLTQANKLQTLLLGSDVDGYKNDLFKQDKKVILGNGDIGFPLLEKVNLSKLSNYKTTMQEFNKSEKLQEFRALDSGLTGVEFASGAKLQICYLPKSIEFLRLSETNQLQNLIESSSGLILETDYNEATNETVYTWRDGLYIEGLTNYLNPGQVNDEDDLSKFVNINELTIAGNTLGVNSYRLLQTLINIKEKLFVEDQDNKYNKDLSIHMTNLNWCPYKQVEKGAPKLNNEAYFKKTDHYTFEPYAGSSLEWADDTLNGRVYIKEEMEEYITDLAFLDTLINNVGDRYHDSTGKKGTTPYLQGIIYVHGKIDEADIRNKYMKAFPGLEFYAESVEPAYTIKYVEVQEDGKEYVWEMQKYANISYDDDYKVQSLSEEPVKQHYDFLGWSLTPSSTVMDEKQPTDYTLNEIISQMVDRVITFYTVYEKNKYIFKFYNHDGSALDGISDINSPDYPWTLKIEYGQNLFVPDYVPYADDSNLTDYYTFSFTGYSEESNINPSENSGTLSLQEIQQLQSLRDRNFYARYNQVNVKENIHPEYFVANQNTTIDGINGVVLSLKTPIKGKLTIPAYFNNKPVLVIDPTFSANSGNGLGLTHIFFEDGTQIKEFYGIGSLNQGTFYGNINLRYIEIPDSLKVIGNYCFRDCKNLTIKDNYLGSSLEKIHNYAFTDALASGVWSDSETVIHIPSTLLSLSERSLSNLNTGINKLQIGTAENPVNTNFLPPEGTIVFSAGSARNAMNVLIYTDQYSKEEVDARVGGISYVNTQVIGAK